ncbi:MAG: hypothetical protein EOM25_03205, partial [Deltaproteobacteria bacterium]|nr:hypothetical protein [Deltaproteobacteria bacterium]
MSVRFSRWMVLGVALAVVATAWPSGQCRAGDISLLRIGTGGLLGVYYPVGKALAECMGRTAEARGLIAVAQTSGGSVA